MINSKIIEHIESISKEYKYRLGKYGYQHARREYCSDMWKLLRHNAKL